MLTPPSPLLLDDERLDHVNGDLYLIQKKEGLTYGTDAFLLSAFLRPAPYARAVELGGGTGILSLLALIYGKAREITAIELQEAFAALITRNAALNGLSQRLTALQADIREVTPQLVGGECDLVFSNPPYMQAASGRANISDEKYIARHETAGSIYDFCACGARLLKHGGRFLVVYRPDRLADLMDALRTHHLEPKRMTMVHADCESEPCMVLIEARKGGASSMRLSPPLILYENACGEGGKRSLTKEAQQIYQGCDFSGFFPYQ